MRSEKEKQKKKNILKEILVCGIRNL